MKRRCVECGRSFDLFNEVDADEWAYGHDCEPPTAEARRVGQIRNDLAILGRLMDQSMREPGGSKRRALIARDTIRLTNELNTILAGAS